MRNVVLSQMRILDVDSVYAFEWIEPDGSQEAETPDLIRDPFPVTPLQDETYLLLENTRLFGRLSAAGLRHIPAQVYPDSGVALTSERLAVTGFSREDLINLAARYPEQMLIARNGTAAPAGYFPVTLCFTGDAEVTVHLRHSSRVGCAGSLENLFRAIGARGHYLPAVEARYAGDGILKATPPSAYLSLPAFSLSELKAAASSDRLFPPDLIRARTGYRVINIDFPVRILNSDISSDQKNAFLSELIRFRQLSHRTSFFEGQLYILNT